MAAGSSTTTERLASSSELISLHKVERQPQRQPQRQRQQLQGVVITRIRMHPQTTRGVSYARERGGHTRAAEAISNSAGTKQTPPIITNDRQVAKRRRNRSTPTGTDGVSIWGPPNRERYRHHDSVEAFTRTRCPPRVRTRRQAQLGAEPLCNARLSARLAFERITLPGQQTAKTPTRGSGVAVAHCANSNPTSPSQNKAELSGHTLTTRQKDDIKTFHFDQLTAKN